MKDVVYYVPHQDDEVTNFGVSILNHRAEGYRIHLVLCTDGSGSRVRRILNGEEYCEWHACTHQFQFSQEDFIQARNVEFAWSAGCLGVPSERIYWEQTVKDGELTEEHGIRLIRKYAAKFPEARHITFTYGDAHPDHASLGRALNQLCLTGEIKDARFQIKHVEAEKWEGIVEVCADDLLLPFLMAANHSYRVYQPDLGYYAVGYHSVPQSFDQQLAQPRSQYHLKGELKTIRDAYK